MFDKIGIGDNMLFQKKKQVDVKQQCKDKRDISRQKEINARKKRIMNVLKSNSHIKKCDISLEEKEAVLWVDETANLEEIKQKIEALDFQVTDIKE